MKWQEVWSEQALFYILKNTFNAILGGWQLFLNTAGKRFRVVMFLGIEFFHLHFRR